MNTNWLIRSQSIFTLAAGMVYPFYLLFLKNLGNSYSKYGLAFAVFTISSAAISQLLSKRLDRYAHILLMTSSIGMMATMLVFPWINSFSWVIVLQLAMGACNAMQKTSEKLLIANHTEMGSRGEVIGSYHFWTSIAAGIAVIIGGYLIDWLTINALFYVSALLYGWSAWTVWRRDSYKKA